MNIAVVGTGYVGLVTGTCLAENGNVVTCIDNNPDKIQLLNGGGIPIYEPGLTELVLKNTHEERLLFTTDLTSAVKQAQLIFIAVGTPQSNAGDADLRAVWAVAKSIALALKDEPVGPPGSRVVITKSTVPVGTNARVAEILAENGCPHVDIASNPEFLKEGAAIEDFMKPDRVVVGVRKPEVAAVLQHLYAPFLRTERPFLVMSPESSEMTKYVANAMLATKISFINEMANLCDQLHADINDVRKGIGHDQRIGFQFLFPGPGYGGSCFPKDIRAILGMGRNVGLDLHIMQSVDNVNESQKEVLFQKVQAHFGADLTGKTFAVWGLAFKPRTDDIREAPALVFIERVLAAGGKIRAHDPEAMPNVREQLGERITYCEKPYDTLTGADALVLVTEWQEFRTPDFAKIHATLKSPVIFDGRNIYNEHQLAALGFDYYGIGRGKRLK